MSEENAVLEMAGLAVDETPAEAETDTTETPEPTEAKGEIEPTEEAQAEPTEDAPPAPTEDTPKGIDPQYAAMLEKANDHKTKWQAEKDRADQLQQQLDTASQTPAPDPMDNPEGFTQWQQDQIANLRTEFNNSRSNDRIDMSRMLIMTMKDDYETVEQVFLDEAKDNPALVRQFNEASNPALFAYEQGQKIQMLSTDPVAVREQIRAEERAKLEVELKGEGEKAAEKAAQVDNALKPSLAKEGNPGLESDPPLDLDAVASMTGEDALRRKRG